MRFAARTGCAALAALTLLAPLPTNAVPERHAWVVGANDGSVAVVDLDSGTVEANVAAVGFLANRIEADPAGAFAVVVCSGSDDLHVLDLATRTVTARVVLPAGSNPWDVEIVGDRLFVTSLLGDRLHVLQAPGGAAVGEVEVGVAPQGMCVAGGRLWVANTGFDFSTFEWGPGTVSVVDPATLAVVATVPVHLNPQECVAGPDGRVHVVCTGDFDAVQGAIDVIDPATGTVVATRPVPGWPGTATARPALPAVYVGVTTTSFGAHVLSYDAASLAWIRGPDDPLLPSLGFYGNLRTSERGELLVTDFAADLLLVETPDAPGAPAAYLVGDGPIDLAVVEREEPVSLAVSALSAREERDGVRLAWTGSPEAGVAAFAVERGVEGEPAALVADGLPAARRAEWLDRDAPPGRRATWRVLARDAGGRPLGEATVSLVRRGAAGPRLTIRAVMPNPARGETRIDWSAPAAGEGRLEILDVAGRRVLARALGGVPRGEGSAAWDGRGDDGRPVAPGVFLVRLVVGDASATARVLRLR